MAQSITIWNAEDEKILKFRNAVIDACNSHTLIILSDEFTIIRLPFTITGTLIRPRKTVIYYENGFSIAVLT